MWLWFGVLEARRLDQELVGPWQGRADRMRFRMEIRSAQAQSGSSLGFGTHDTLHLVAQQIASAHGQEYISVIG